MGSNDSLFGIYRGQVVSNDDPQKRGRLRVKIPDALGDVGVWALPSLPIGIDVLNWQKLLPEPGSGVWIVFEAGRPDFPVWIGTMYAP